jgi:serine/threonine protein kinase
MSADGERQRLGIYETLMELASGGIGTVDVALHRGVAGFERLVVTKRLHKFILRNPDALPMFRDEARVASSIRHPNVVPVIDVVEAPGELLLVMEYVEGVSLATLCKALGDAGVAMPGAVAVRIVSDALAGLHSAHEAADVRGRKLEIVHRDVSPQNVLVGVDGTARVIDFGIAKATGRLTETQSGFIKGKFAYMSPEQIDSLELDRRSDIFSAAVVLFEALTCQRLFQAESDMATLRKVLKGEVPDPSTLVRGVPHELDAVLRCALAKDRDQRFLTALAFQTALESALPPAPVRDVAAVVHKYCATELEERRRALAAALGGADRLAKTLPDSGPPMTVPEPTGAVESHAPASRTTPEHASPLMAASPRTLKAASGHTYVPAEYDTRVSATTDLHDIVRPPPPAWAWVALAAVLGLVTAAALVFWPKSPPAPPPAATANPTPTPSATLAPTPTPTPTLTPIPTLTPTLTPIPTLTPTPIPTLTPTPTPIPTLTPTPTLTAAADAGRGKPKPPAVPRKGDDLRHDFDPGHSF